MGFIDPRTDFGFKRIFGSPRSKPVLRSFLNAIVYDGRPAIADLELIDPFQPPEIDGLKTSILDVKVSLDNGTTAIIEMQFWPVIAFIPRILYNTAKAYAGQLKRGKSYRDLQPIVAVTITNFVLFENDARSLTKYQILEAQTHQLCSDHLTWFFVELPKFSKEVSALQSLAEQWMFFLRHARELNEAPAELQADPDFETAFAIANRSQLSPQELEQLEKQEMKLWDVEGQLDYARQEGREEGIEEGLQQGREEGIEEGEQRAKLQIAREMLKTIAPETVSHMTGLSVEILRDLENEESTS